MDIDSVWELKAQLQKLLRLGTAAKPQIDALVDMNVADLSEDFRTTLGLASMSRRELLSAKLSEGCVVSRRYAANTGGGEQGCLVYWLFGWHSNADLLAAEFADAETLAAVVRTIRGWDYEILTPALVRCVLDEELASPCTMVNESAHDSGGLSERQRRSARSIMSSV